MEAATVRERSAWEQVKSRADRSLTIQPGAAVAAGLQDPNKAITSATTGRLKSPSTPSRRVNIWNHTNYSGINTSLGSSTFGQVTSTRDPLIVQLGLKFYY